LTLSVQFLPCTPKVPLDQKHPLFLSVRKVPLYLSHQWLL
jgi:hypothetical protein